MQASADPDNFNPTMLIHKVGRLNESNMVKLHHKILTHKMKTNLIFDDVLIDVPDEKMEVLKSKQKKPPKKKNTVSGAQSPQSSFAATAPARSPRETTIQFPDKIFLLKREDLRPYTRLDKKYDDLF